MKRSTLKRFIALFTTLAFTLQCVSVQAPVQAAQVLIKQGNTTIPIPFLEVDSTTGQTGQTGKAGSINVNIRYGSTTVTGGGTIAEVDSAHLPGVYAYTPTATESGTLGILYIHTTCTGCMIYDGIAQIVAFDPNDSAALGLSTIASTGTTTASTNTRVTTGVPNAAPGAAGGVIIEGGTTATNMATLLNGLVLATGAISDGSSTTTVLDTNLSTSAGDIYTGDTFVVTSGTYKGKSTHISAFNTGTGQVTVPSGAFPAPLTNGTTFTLASFSKTLVSYLSSGFPLTSSDETHLANSDSQSATGASQATTAATHASNTDTRTSTALPNAAPGTTNGLPLTSSVQINVTVPKQ